MSRVNAGAATDDACRTYGAQASDSEHSSLKGAGLVASRTMTRKGTKVAFVFLVLTL
jgi:hypothetical protein